MDNDYSLIFFGRNILSLAKKINPDFYLAIVMKPNKNNKKYITFFIIIIVEGRKTEKIDFVLGANQNRASKYFIISVNASDWFLSLQFLS